MYISCVSFLHKVVPKNRWVAVCSANVETKDPGRELVPALQLLGKIDAKCVFVCVVCVVCVYVVYVLCVRILCELLVFFFAVESFFLHIYEQYYVVTDHRIHDNKNNAIITLTSTEPNAHNTQTHSFRFLWVSDTYVPTGDDGKDTNCFITASYDATSHFETSTNEVMELYTAMTGKTVNLDINTDPDELEKGKG